MAEPARKIDVDKARQVLSRLLAPRLVSQALAEMVEPVSDPEPPRPSKEAVERARAWARREAGRR